jgi:chromosome segregation ATPase
MGRLDVLDTPAGRIINTLAKYGSIGISSRGSGELKMTEGRSIVDPTTYEYLTHDCVADPACAGSYPKLVMESLARQDLDSADVQKDFSFFEGVYKKLGVNLTELKETRNPIKESVEEPKIVIQPDLERINFLESRITELTEVVSSITEASTIKDSEARNMRVLVSVIEETRNDLQDRLESLTEKFQGSETKNQELVEKLKNIEGKNEKLIQNIEKQKKQLERRIQRISTTDSKNTEEVKILQSKVNESKIQVMELQNELEQKSKALTLAEKKVKEEKVLRTGQENSYKLLKEEFEQFKTQHTMPRTEPVKPTGEIFKENSTVECSEPMNERLNLVLSKMKN